LQDVGHLRLHYYPCADLSTEIATITYRSGPEWDQRFGRKMRTIPQADPNGIRKPALCPDFLIETYLDHQVLFVVDILRSNFE
jgi:homoserine acetyltransferase